MNPQRRAQSRSAPARSGQSRSGQSRSFTVRKNRRALIGAIAACVAAASWIFIFCRISFLPALAVTDVHVYGAEADVTPRLEAAAYQSLQGSYLGIFSKANALLYPKEAVQAAVAAVSARVSGVTVTRDGLHALTIAVTEKTPAAVACASLPNFDAGGMLMEEPAGQNSCYFADDTGLMFRKIAGGVPDSYARYYVPSLSDSPVGHFATSTATFKSLQAFVDGVRANSIVPQALLIKAGGEYELYVRNPAEAGSSASSTAIVYFNDASPFPSELANLAAFWGTMKKKDFEYIDLRYSPNVFYRLIQ